MHRNSKKLKICNKLNLVFSTKQRFSVARKQARDDTSIRFGHLCPILDNRVPFQSLVSDFRQQESGIAFGHLRLILDTRVQFWLQVSHFEL